MFDYRHMMVSGLTGGVLFLLSLLWKNWYLVLLFVGLKYGIPYFLATRQRRQLSGIGIADVDTLDGKRFEIYLEVRFRERGYRVQRTPYQGDWGADLILEKDGQRTAVQAKRYKKNVGVRAVQEAAAAKGKYKCDRALVVTNSKFTKPALELAAANAVELWDRERLIRELMAIRPEDVPTTTTPAATAEVEGVAAFHAEVSPNERRQQDVSRAETAVPPSASMLPTPKEVVPSELADAGDAAVCAVCGKALTPKVEAYCRTNAGRFGGRVLCYEHQRSRS